MKKRSVLIHVFIIGLTLAWFGISVSSCGQHEYEGKILLVQGPADESGAGSQFVLFDPEDNKLRTLELKQEFVLMGSPDVSYDGQRLLFEAKRKATDPWVVWELNLGDSDLNRVTPAESDCRYPAYLPDGRIVYSRYVQEQDNTEATEDR